MVYFYFFLNIFFIISLTCHTQSRKSRNTGDSCLCLVKAWADFAHLFMNGCPACNHSLSINASNLGGEMEKLQFIQ